MPPPIQSRQAPEKGMKAHHRRVVADKGDTLRVSRTAMQIRPEGRWQVSAYMAMTESQTPAGNQVMTLDLRGPKENPEQLDTLGTVQHESPLRAKEPSQDQGASRTTSFSLMPSVIMAKAVSCRRVATARR